MTDGRSPVETVLALVRVINNEAPRETARDLLDPMVEIRMDRLRYRGIEVWYKWIHLIRNCGRVANLRLTQCQARSDAGDPSLVYLSARWTGMSRKHRTEGTAAGSGEACYRVRDGRITQIQTHRSNYEFIFGRWIRYLIGYWALLAWSAAYFTVMSLRRKEYLADHQRADYAGR